MANKITISTEMQATIRQLIIDAMEADLYTNVDLVKLWADLQ